MRSNAGSTRTTIKLYLCYVSTFFFLTDKDGKERTSAKLGLPLSYDRRYKINVALLSKDVTDVTGYSTTGTKKGVKICVINLSELTHN